MRRLVYILTLVLLVFPDSGNGQFGKNKVQYRDFDWEFLQSPHFDIYFYSDGLPLAEFTSDAAEDAYRQISRHLSWDLRKRVSIIIYNSHNDFQQTNVTYEYMPEGVGGVTELFKNRVVIPFEGSYEQFRHVIHHELVHAMINDMIYGGSAQSMVQNRVQVTIPLWMNEGLAEYLSMKWDTQADMVMRDVAVHDRIPDIRELNYYMAYKGGQAVWRFIVDKYGWEKVGEIFTQAKRQQDVTKAFQKSLGLDFKDMSKQWQKWLKREYWPDVAGRDEIEDFAHRITDHEELKNYFNISPAISPDGSKIALISDQRGYSDIYLISASDGKTIKKLIKGNRTPDFEELKLLQPGISWSPDGKQIVLAAKAGERDALFMVNVESGEQEKVMLDFDGIFTAAWSPNGKSIAFVGNKGSASDIYLYDLDDKELVALTADIFSDSEPSWSPDGKSLAFVSDRGSILETGDNFKMWKHDYRQTDIYTLEIATGNITRITDTPYQEDFPVWSHTSNSLAYTSDQLGVWNLYILDMDSGKSRAVSNVLTGVFQLSWSRDDQELIFSGYSDVGWDIYSVSNPLDLATREVSPSNFVLTGDDEFEETVAVVDEKPVIPESEYDKSAFSRYIFAPEYSHHNTGIVDTTDTVEKPLAVGEFKNSDGSHMIHPYKTRFSLDLVNGQAMYSNVFGYIGTTIFAFSDILGDHRIFLGTELVVNLENSDYFIQYDYLKHRTDFSFSLFHTANFWGPQWNYVRLRYYNLDFSMSRPFNKFQRAEFGVTNNFVNLKQFQLVNYNDYVVAADESLNLLTYHGGWVFDNSAWGYTGPADGWRMKLQFLQSLPVLGNKLDFKTILYDGRRYFRLSQLYSFALRFMSGYSFGSNPQKFFLGGTENWILGRGETDGVKDEDRFNRDDSDIFNSEGEDYLKDIYFSIFVLPVRGARLIEKYGSKVFITNFEFRFPFVNYMALGFPFRIIFGNIQGVLFVDAGASWDDKFQFTKTDPITGVKKFDDFIMGYGTGIRLNIGYTILRLDTAWDYTPRGSSRPQYYLSLGTDF